MRFDEPPTSEEVLDSLADELALPQWSSLASLAGVAALALTGLVRRKRPPTLRATALYVSNVPNGRLGTSARSAVGVIALELPQLEVVADRRLADDGFVVDRDFPGLGLRSLLPGMDREALAIAMSGAWRARSRPAAGRTSRLQFAYLLLAQQVRYALAARLVAHSSDGLLFTDFDRSSYAAPLVHVARIRGWLTATTVHGSLNPETYCPFRAEHVLVWGEAQAEVAKQHGASVHLVGRSDLAARPMDDSPVRRVVICESGEQLSAGEAERLVGMCHTAMANDWELVLRRHPRYKVLGDSESWRTVSALAPSAVATRALALDLRPGDLVVGIGSTSLVDALIGGYRVVSFADETRTVSADVALMVRRQKDGCSGESLAALQGSIMCATGDAAFERLRSVVARLVELHRS